jgi:hypothetical protein
MELSRRFIFRGNAAAFGGRFVRPEDIVLEMPGASSLPVTGGRSVARIGRTQFKEFLSFDSASTFAEGTFDDRQAAIALSHHTLQEDALTASTRVQAEIRKLVVGSQQRLTVERLAAELRAKSPEGSGEPRITLGDVMVEGVVIDGFKLRVEIERGVFQRFDTHAKLLTAADDPDFVRRHGKHLFMTTHFEGRPAPPPPGRLVPGCETIYATIVRAIDWDGPPDPAAHIDHHSVIVKDFGRIFFGELLITSSSRRLTLMRLELGSDGGGSAGGPDLDINGSYS